MTPTHIVWLDVSVVEVEVMKGLQAYFHVVLELSAEGLHYVALFGVEEEAVLVAD